MNVSASTTDTVSGLGPSALGKIALVVDDEPSNRTYLRVLLRKLGYEVQEAEHGKQAIAQVRNAEPDIIFMDVIMPVMDGIEATREIKDYCHENFVPVIFLTALDDEATLSRCIDAGGDDFLTKPFSHNVLRSKIKAMERIRNLHRQTTTLTQHLQREEEIAEQVFSGAVVADNVAMEHIDKLVRPAGLFSGDVLLTAFSPSGDLHVLLGDFTGHGLAAALGALPASVTFRSMTAKGYEGSHILNEINRQLHHLLPTGMFMAVNFLHISRGLDYITLYNCGMPDILLLDGTDSRVKQRASSSNLPLGIVERLDINNKGAKFLIQPGDRILIHSDGLPEARNAAGEHFGMARILQAISATNYPDTSLVDAISMSLRDFCLDAAQDDDISVVEIPCCQHILLPLKTAMRSAPPPMQTSPIKDATNFDEVRVSIRLGGDHLRNADPIPLLLDQLQEIVEIENQRRPLFTILSELYLNALDHGLLRLDSSLKTNSVGFAQYYSERERRLREQVDGHVSIAIERKTLANGGQILIRVEDSGPGFDVQSVLKHESRSSDLCGRGIMLVSELCQSLHFFGNGNQVEATYLWSDELDKAEISN